MSQFLFKTPFIWITTDFNCKPWFLLISNPKHKFG